MLKDSCTALHPEHLVIISWSPFRCECKKSAADWPELDYAATPDAACRNLKYTRTLAGVSTWWDLAAKRWVHSGPAMLALELSATTLDDTALSTGLCTLPLHVPQSLAADARACAGRMTHQTICIQHLLKPHLLYACPQQVSTEFSLYAHNRQGSAVKA